MTRSTRLILFVACLIAIGTLGLHSRVAADESPLYGYSAESSRAERQWEEKLRAIPSPDNMREYMRRLSARPHNVGSPYDKDNADWLVSRRFVECCRLAHPRRLRRPVPGSRSAALKLKPAICSSASSAQIGSLQLLFNHGIIVPFHFRSFS